MGAGPRGSDEDTEVVGTVVTVSIQWQRRTRAIKEQVKKCTGVANERPDKNKR